MVRAKYVQKRKAAYLQGFRDAPERTRTSTAYKGHKALNLVKHRPESTQLSICRDVSAPTDVLEANGEAFVTTAVVTPNNSGRIAPGAASAMWGFQLIGTSHRAPLLSENRRNPAAHAS
jgi:hypothetical protein